MWGSKKAIIDFIYRPNQSHQTKPYDVLAAVVGDVMMAQLRKRNHQKNNRRRRESENLRIRLWFEFFYFSLLHNKEKNNYKLQYK